MNTRQPALDLTVVESLRELQTPGGPDLFEQLTVAFLEDAQARLTDLRQAVAGNDRTQAQRAAHSLRGMCGAIGATEMAALSDELERTAVAASVDARLAAGLEREFSCVATALRALLRTSGNAPPA
ncbi:MAG: hypothetical protein A3J29_22115 [Acidobacteria bacterium RIFCSPLOWO2_12_FULL_67_14b]|nr:MAG: hypothetical protein A3J29_22115 [Acidobacteria bacterium RIFCSPLOWO2_12_FULL_67_14b]